jgi:hypothetical protein
MECNEVLVVRPADTDVFVLLLGTSFDVRTKIIFDTGVGNKHRYIKVSDIALTVGDDVCRALPAFHAFTRCDSTSAFASKGKKNPYKLMSGNSTFLSVFQQLGEDSKSVPQQLHEHLEHFVCCMYGLFNHTDVNKARSVIFKSRYNATLLTGLTSQVRCGIDLSLLPPCRAALKKHILRCNYQAYIWKHAHVSFPSLPSPIGCGWTKSEDGFLHVDWIDGDILPPSLIDILANDEEATKLAEMQSENVEEDDEIDNILDEIFEHESDDDE